MVLNMRSSAFTIPLYPHPPPVGGDVGGFLLRTLVQSDIGDDTPRYLFSDNEVSTLYSSGGNAFRVWRGHNS